MATAIRASDPADFFGHTFPPKLYCAAGREGNLYWANCLRGGKAKSLIDVDVTLGSAIATAKQQNERWTYTPADGDANLSGDVTTQAATIRAYYGRRKLATHALSIVTAKSTAGPAPGNLNLLQNGGFESGTGSAPANWTINGIRTEDDHQGETGTWCAKPNVQWGLLRQSVSLKPATTYTLSFWVKKGVGTIKWWMHYHNGSGYITWNATTQAWTVPTAYNDLAVDGTWKLFQYTFTTPPGGAGNDGNGGTFADSQTVDFSTNNWSEATCYHFVDNVSLVEASKGYRNILFIGDSTGSAGTNGPLGELKRLFAADAYMGLTFVGPLTVNSVPDSLGGTHTIYNGSKSGYAWNTFYQTYDSGNNPFIAGAGQKFDIRNWAGYTSLASGDWVIFALGLNDLGAANWIDNTQAQIDACTAVIQTALEYMIGLGGSPPAGSILQACAAGVRVGICLPIMSADQDACGANYGSTYSAYLQQEYQHGVRRWLLDTYGDLEGSGVYLIPYHAAIDTLHNMPYASASDWNVRATSDPPGDTYRQSNLVHPAQPGYYQLSDALYAFLKCQEP